MQLYERDMRVKALVEVVDLLCQADGIICEVERSSAADTLGVEIAKLREEVRHATSQACILRAALETNDMNEREVDDLISNLCEQKL